MWNNVSANWSSAKVSFGLRPSASLSRSSFDLNHSERQDASQNLDLLRRRIVNVRNIICTTAVWQTFPKILLERPWIRVDSNYFDNVHNMNIIKTVRLKFDMNFISTRNLYSKMGMDDFVRKTRGFRSKFNNLKHVRLIGQWKWRDLTASFRHNIHKQGNVISIPSKGTKQNVTPDVDAIWNSVQNLASPDLTVERKEKYQTVMRNCSKSQEEVNWTIYNMLRDRW